MARYDWPPGPFSRDDPLGRTEHLTRFRRPVDVTTLPEPSPAANAKARRAARDAGEAREAGPIAHLAPSGPANVWLPIGPSVMLNGQAAGKPNVAGRIRDMQVETTNGLRVYAASASGGVWYSANTGSDWRPLDSWVVSPDLDKVGIVANALACGAIHVIWGAFQGDDEVWVGTGELAGGARIQPGAAVNGIGFLHMPKNSNAWQIVKGDPVATDPDTLRGETVYRIAGDPGNKDQLVAATSKGIYVLPLGGSWTRTTAPAWTGGTPVDVAVTRAAGKVRIWAVEYSKLWVAETAHPINPGTLVFTQVGLPDVVNDPTANWQHQTTRLAIAPSSDGTVLYVLGRRTAEPEDDRIIPPAGLWQVDADIATASLPTLAAVKLPGLPVALFGSKHDQSYYDMCIATHPTATDTLYVGGSTIETDEGHNGAIYRCKIKTDPSPHVEVELIGRGVHPDVHQLRVGAPAFDDPSKRMVWVGCDGGLFSSFSDGDPGTFFARNDGLAVLEPGYVASHPTNPGLVAAGFQDNGTAVRSGDTVWWQDFAGDGGGVVYDPGAPNRYLRQYTEAHWHSSDNGAIRPVHRRNARQRGTLETSESLENDVSRFYSGAAAVRHPLPGGDSHLAFGSDRVWYSRDWGRSWVTLPTGSDPRAADSPNLDQDVLDPLGPRRQFLDRVGSTDCCASQYPGRGVTGSGILMVKFAVPNDSGGNHRLRVLALYATGLVWLEGTRATGAAGTPFTWTKPHTEVFRDPNTPAETASYNAGNPMPFLPAPSDAQRIWPIVSDVAVHQPDRGPLGSCYVSTIGDSDPTTRRDTLWFFDGIQTWFPCGLRTNNATRGTWPVPADRVTAPALGVVVDPGNADIVYVATSVGVLKGEIHVAGTAPNETFSWTWTRFMNGLPEAAVQDLSIFHSGPQRLLRAALQARGVWETDLANPNPTARTYLRLYRSDTRRVVPTPLSGATTTGEKRPAGVADDGPLPWDDSPDIAVLTGQGATEAKTEAELRALEPPPPGTKGRVLLEDRHPEVHVLVHHRWFEPAQPNQVRVALLRHELPANGQVQLGGLWQKLLDSVASNTPQALADGWTKAATEFWKNPSEPIDVRMPVDARFTLDLTGDQAGTAFVLVAVVMSETNQITAADLLTSPPAATTATTVEELVKASSHVAAKTIELTGDP